MSDSTMIRVNRSTIHDMRRAAIEISYKTGLLFDSDDQRLSALIEHFHHTKQTLPPAEQDSAGVSTPSPRQDMKRNPQMPA